MLLFALFLAGLGLFFHGLSGLRQAMQALASRRARQVLARWSESPALCGLWGFCLGALTQSVTAVAFIVSSLVGGRLISVRRALPVVACANFGTAALVLVASFDIHVAVLLVLGLTGLAVAFDFGGRLRAFIVPLFYVALLFFGLRLMKDAFGGLPQQPWFGSVTALVQSSLLGAFLLGATLRLFIQSSPAIAVIAITLNRAGILSYEQVVFVIFGTGVGVGGAVLLLASNLRGLPRQIALFQALLCSTAGSVCALLLAVELVSGTPLILALLGSLTPSEPLRLALAFASMQVFAVALALTTLPWSVGWLARLAPSTAEQDLACPEFINDVALRDPGTALILASREQQRLLSRLTGLVDTVRAETAAAAPVTREALFAASMSVAAEVRAFLGALGSGVLEPRLSQALLHAQQRQGLVTDLLETVQAFAAACERLRAGGVAAELVDSLAEGLHALIATVTEACADPSVADRELIVAMTADRSAMMERLHSRVLAATPAMEGEMRLHLVHTTSVFERAVWLLRQLSRTDLG